MAKIRRRNETSFNRGYGVLVLSEPGSELTTAVLEEDVQPDDSESAVAVLERKALASDFPSIPIEDEYGNHSKIFLPIEGFATEEPFPSISEVKEAGEKAKTNILSYLESEIFDAIVKLNINSDHLKELYHGFKENPETFKQLAVEGPSDIEVRIAEYVAFGTESLTTYELLEQPLFYQALHKVINRGNFEKAKREGRKIYEECQPNSKVKTDVEEPSYKKRRRTEAVPVNVSSKTNKRGGLTYKEAVSRRWKAHGIGASSTPVEDTVGIQPSLRTIRKDIQRRLGLPTTVALEYALALPQLKQAQYKH